MGKKGVAIVIKNKTRRVIGLAMLIILVLTSAAYSFAAPEGVVNVSIISSERRTAPSPVSVPAQGGNITRLDLAVSSQTIAWQGFAGNVTAEFVLDDTSNETFYQWNITNVTGEIFASRNGTLDFTSVFPQNDCTIDEELTSTRADRVSRTFFSSSNTVNFSVGNIEINATTACSLRPFINSTSQAGTNLFENIILVPENGSNTTIYTGIIDTAVNGYDGLLYDFQMLVPVNRSTGFEQYFFYAEVE